MKFCRNFADILENVENFRFFQIFYLVRERSPPRCLKAVCFPFLWPLLVSWVACHFDEVVFRGFLWIPRILTELRSEKFEWFGPSPIEPFNSGPYRSVWVELKRSNRQHRFPHLGDLYTESGQTLQGSFAAVSKPYFASKYSLESSRRDLHKLNALL